jgi:hypothetical protein
MSTNKRVAVSPWTGWVAFAGLLLLFVGCINVIQGLAAIFENKVFVIPAKSLLVTTSYNSWGVTLVIWGVLMALAGLGLFFAKEWSRWVAIAAVFVNLIIQFVWFPAFPLWCLVVIAVDIFILVALTIHWHDVRADLRS